MHLDKGDQVPKASRLKNLFGTKQQKPCTLDLPKENQKTILGEYYFIKTSSAIHCAFLRDVTLNLTIVAREQARRGYTERCFATNAPPISRNTDCPLVPAVRVLATVVSVSLTVLSAAIALHRRLARVSVRLVRPATGARIRPRLRTYQRYLFTICILDLKEEFALSLTGSGTSTERSSMSFFVIFPFSTAADIRPVRGSTPTCQISAGICWHLLRYRTYRHRHLRRPIILIWSIRRYSNPVLTPSRMRRYCVIAAKIVRTQLSNETSQIQRSNNATKDNNFLSNDGL